MEVNFDEITQAVGKLVTQLCVEKERLTQRLVALENYAQGLKKRVDALEKKPDEKTE